VYGVWTEKPLPPPPSDEKSKSAEGKEAKPQPRGTVVKLGTADFSGKPQAGSAKTGF